MSLEPGVVLRAVERRDGSPERVFAIDHPKAAIGAIRGPTLLNRYFPPLFAEAETTTVLHDPTERRLIVMRAVIALIVIVYLVGIGVVLSPVFQAEWNSGSASNLAASIGQALPSALAWPAGIYHSMTDHG